MVEEMLADFDWTVKTATEQVERQGEAECAIGGCGASEGESGNVGEAGINHLGLPAPGLAPTREQVWSISSLALP